MTNQLLVEADHYRTLVDGAWRTPASNLYLTITAPSDNSIVGYVPAMGQAEAVEAIESAKRAQKAWAALPVHERSEILIRAAALLDERAEEIGSVIMREVAKKRSSAIDEVKRTADLIRFTAEEGKRVNGQTLQGDAFPGYNKNKVSFVTRVPLGVILAISPFNYPVNLSASKIAPALATGNSVVFKPATQGAISALHLVKAFHDAGLPAGVLNTVVGKGAEIGDFLVQHPDIAMISFTGGSQNGSRIAKLAGMIPLVMELGGKDAAIILPDADLDLAAKQIVSGAFSYSGQRCTAVKRILVHQGVADQLIEKMVPLIKKLSVGAPEDNADITPLISDSAADYVQGLIDDAVANGSSLVTGGRRDGRTIHPTLLDNVTVDMRIAWEEPFGPVLPIIRVSSTEQAIEIANASEYGLQSSVFTQDIGQAFRISEQLEVGSVQINGRTERGPDHFPFIGVKSSGMGTQGIAYSLQSMTRQKSMVININ
ncbi:MAG: gapN [Bacilli bacterium]|nr:gapN [Bacilli bacterium]